ncbi:hypothetical protein OS12_48880 [Dickeya oryzae]
MQTEEQRRAFGQRLKVLRNRHRRTQKDMAVRLGVQISQYNKYESGDAHSSGRQADPTV